MRRGGQFWIDYWQLKTNRMKEEILELIEYWGFWLTALVVVAIAASAYAVIWIIIPGLIELWSR